MEELAGFESALMVLQTISLTNLDTTPPEKMAGTSGFEPEHAVVKVLCLTSLDIRHIFGASHGTRTRTRKSELPPQDSVSTKFHQERIFYFEIGSKWTQTIVSLTVIEVVSPQCCLTTCFQCPLRDSNPALRA